MIDLTPIINAVIALIAAIISVKVIPWIKAKTTNEQQAMMRATVKTLVFAAEQVYGAGEGYAKMTYVKNGLRKRGFDIDVDEIEAAVGEYINNFPVLEIAEPEQEAE
jgi:uncharacterized membrane protein YozB (DUF420 family)